MYSELNRLARTQEERETLKEELQSLYDSLYEKQSAFEECLDKVRPTTGETVKRLLTEGKIADRAKFIKEADKYLDSLTILELTVAFDPKGKSIERIWEWTRRNVGEGIVLKFTLDRLLGAGAIVTYQGKIRNYSLSRFIDDYFESSKPSLVHLLS